MVGGLQGGHGSANLRLGAVPALCRTAPYLMTPGVIQWHMWRSPAPFQPTPETSAPPPPHRFRSETPAPRSESVRPAPDPSHTAQRRGCGVTAWQETPPPPTPGLSHMPNLPASPPHLFSRRPPMRRVPQQPLPPTSESEVGLRTTAAWESTWAADPEDSVPSPVAGDPHGYDYDCDFGFSKGPDGHTAAAMYISLRTTGRPHRTTAQLLIFWP